MVIGRFPWTSARIDCGLLLAINTHCRTPELGRGAILPEDVFDSVFDSHDRTVHGSARRALGDLARVFLDAFADSFEIHRHAGALNVVGRVKNAVGPRLSAVLPDSDNPPGSGRTIPINSGGE